MKGDADYLKAKSETETENSDMSSMSSMQSVDEGAVAMLSMDQIRNMRQAKLNAKLSNRSENEDDDEYDQEKGYVKSRFNVEKRHSMPMEDSNHCILEVDLEDDDSNDSIKVPVGGNVTPRQHYTNGLSQDNYSNRSRNDDEIDQDKEQLEL